MAQDWSSVGLGEISRHATVAFSCVINAVLPYMPPETHSHLYALLRFNESYPVLLIVPIVFSMIYVLASVSGIDRIFTEFIKAVVAVAFTIGPVIALSGLLSIYGAIAATLVFYIVAVTILNRGSRAPKPAVAHAQTIAIRR